MEVLSVKNHLKFACFDYENYPNPKVGLGNIIFKSNESYKKEYPDVEPEIGVVIQTHKEFEDFRTDMFGNDDFSNPDISFATLEQIKKYRPELLSELK